MVLTGLEALIALVVGAVCANKPWQVVQLGIWLWFFVPAAVISQSFAISLDNQKFVHPASALVLGGLILQVARNRRVAHLSYRRRIGRNMVAVALVMTLARCLLSGSGMALWLNQWAAPLAAFALIGYSRKVDPNSLRAISRVFVLAAGMAAIIAIVGAAQGTTSPYAEAMRATYYWFDLDVAVSRQSSTMDGPLALAFVCALAICLVPAFRRVELQVTLAALVTVGSVLTQARTATAMCVVGIAYLILQRSSGLRTRAAGVIVCVLAYLAVTQYGLLGSIASRVQSDNGSAAARGEAWKAFFRHTSDVGLFGLGPGSSGRFAQAIGLRTSFESAFTSYVVEFGLFVGLLMFLGMLLIGLSTLRGRRLPGMGGAGLAVLLALILIETFSSTNTQAVVGFALWVMLGLTAFSEDDNTVSSSRPSRSTRRRSRFTPTPSVVPPLVRPGA